MDISLSPVHTLLFKHQLTECTLTLEHCYEGCHQKITSMHSSASIPGKLHTVFHQVGEEESLKKMPGNIEQKGNSIES